MRVLLGVPCAWLAVACAPADRIPGSTTFRDSAGVRIVENGAGPATCVLEPSADLDLGTVQGPEAHQFPAPGDAATLGDGRIAVLDRALRRIRIFRPDGSFDLAFGGEGEGPGELRAALKHPLRASTRSSRDLISHRAGT